MLDKAVQGVYSINSNEMESPVDFDMMVSLNRGPKYTPNKIIIIIMGTVKKSIYPLILENPKP